jgi:hypothetical protein
MKTLDKHRTEIPTNSKNRILVKIMFRWYDLWVGMFIDKSKKRIYIFPIPMLGIMVQF